MLLLRGRRKRSGSSRVSSYLPFRERRIGSAIERVAVDLGAFHRGRFDECPRHQQPELAALGRRAERSKSGIQLRSKLQVVLTRGCDKR